MLVTLKVLLRAGILVLGAGILKLGTLKVLLRAGILKLVEDGKLRNRSHAVHAFQRLELCFESSLEF